MQAHKTLLNWYAKHARHDLPWRQTRDIYHVYLSEIMLQQTQVSRVLNEYYPRFLERFPSLESLAAADLEEVFALWSGLGYYSRARNLHKTARLCPSGLPQNMDALQKLPGIGRYTASAVCSFGLSQCVAVVDTNIARVLRRYFALLDSKESEVWEAAERFLNRSSPREHNLALMDLGAMICTAANPKCGECPLQESCKGRETPMRYTAKKAVKYENLELFLGVCRKGEQIAFVRSHGPMYVGMLELPSVEPIEDEYLDSFKHGYTKYRLTVNLYKKDGKPENAEWLDVKETAHAPISSLSKKALALIRRKDLL